jgi:hypothetical protein
MSADKVRNTSMLITGPSGTGKTTIIRDIMYHLRDRGLPLVVSPSETSNGSYEGIVPASLIMHAAPKVVNDKGRVLPPEKAMLDHLKKIWDRQEMLAELHKRANRQQTLAGLYKRLRGASNHKRTQRILDEIEVQRKKYTRIAEAKLNKRSLVDTIDKKCEVAVRQALKQWIIANAEFLWRQDLSDDERIAVQYVKLDPYLDLTLDDCAATFMKMMENPLIAEFYYRARHVNITFRCVCQDTTDLPASLRRAAFIHIFTSAATARAHFLNPSLRFSTPDQDYVCAILDDIYAVPHRKLIYLREGPPHFFHYTAAVHEPFTYTSPALADLCRLVESEAGALNKDNQFYSTFFPAKKRTAC